MPKPKREGKPEKVKKPGLFRSLEGKGDHIVNITETTGRDGNKVITVEKVKPGNSNN